MDELEQGMDLLADAAAAEQETTIERSFATIGAVYEDGVSLIFDGEAAASTKHYLCNSNCYFAAGDRVRILADGGTYVVEYPVGAPRQSPVQGIPAGGASGQKLAKASGTDYDVEWQDTASDLPSGGSTGDVLTKTSGGTEWAAPAYLPSGGSAGQVLTKKSSGHEWATPNYVPTSGTTGYLLAKTASGAEFQAVPVVDKIGNFYWSATAANHKNNNYIIEFKTDGTSGNKFYIRMGTSGTWKELQLVT